MTFRRNTAWLCPLACCAVLGLPTTAGADDPADFYVPADKRLEAMPHAVLIEDHPLAKWETDGDGLPDDWERRYFHDLDEGADDDPDRDGIPNSIEYQLGTDPTLDNVPEGRSSNRPPALIVSTSAAGATELAMFAVLAHAHDPEGKRVRFAADYRDTGGSGNDEPEFYTDPAESNAHLYWIPAEGRSNRATPCSITLYACDESDVCAQQTISFPVMPAPAESVIFVNTASINYHRRISDTPPKVTVKEGEYLVVENIEVASIDPTVSLCVRFDPPLGDLSDLPRLIKSTGSTTTRFRLDWIPNHTRAGRKHSEETYTITLEAYCNDRPSSAASKLRTHVFNVIVQDMPIAVPPILTVAAGRTLAFDFDVSDWNGAVVEYADSSKGTVLPPGASLNRTTGRFTWPTAVEDAGKSYKLQVVTKADTREKEPVSRSTTNVFHLRVLPPVADDYEGNLVTNPYATHDTRDERWNSGSDGNPDGWTTYGLHSSNDEHEDPLYLAWSAADAQLRSANNVRVGADTPRFGWRQKVDLTPSRNLAVPNGTLYEFAATYRTDGVRLRIQQDGRATGAQDIGLSIGFQDEWGQNLQYAYWASLLSFEAGFDADSWRDDDGCYHELDEHGRGAAEREYKCYVVAPPGARRAVISTENRTPGRLAVSHVSLRSVAENPLIPRFEARDGIIPLIAADKGGEPFFAIGLSDNTPRNYNGGLMPIDAMRRLGFNLMSYRCDRAAEQIAAGMCVFGRTNIIPYAWNVCGNPTTQPRCAPQTHAGFFPGVAVENRDPVPGVSTYYGLDLNRETARKLADAERRGMRVALLDGPDESNCRLRMDGSPPELRELTYAAHQLKMIIDRPYLLNVMFRDDYADIDYAHARIADVISFTWNLPTAYTNSPAGYGPIRFRQAKLGRSGQAVRRWQAATRHESTCNPRSPKPILGFGAAVREWTSWREFAPFHLQRFAIYNQIANGVAGIRFYGVENIDLSLPKDPLHTSQESLADRYHWSQIQEIAAEVALLYEVYLEPTYFGGWRIEENKPIEAMLKRHGGKLYLIATNPSETPLGNVTMTLPESLVPHGISNVTALFEHGRTSSTYAIPTPHDGFLGPQDEAAIRQRGAARINWARRVAVAPGATSFTDSFIDYAVHVYEIVPATRMVDAKATIDPPKGASTDSAF